MSRFRRLLRWGLLAFLGVAVLGALGLGFLYFLIAPKLPDVDQLRTVELQEPLYVYSRDGRLMALGEVDGEGILRVLRGFNLPPV